MLAYNNMLSPNSRGPYSHKATPISSWKRMRKGTRRRMLAVIMLFVLAFIVYDAQFSNSRRIAYPDVLQKRLADLEGRMLRSRRAMATDTRSWPGWKNIKEIYAFGDSHMFTGFHIRGMQPSLENPLGNPRWPGSTMNHGPNFLVHLTGTFNQSIIKTYNLAGKNSPFLPSAEKSVAFSFDQQIEKKFLPKYGKSTKFMPESETGTGSWAQGETLFVIFLGVDDILTTFKLRGGGKDYAQVGVHMDEYERCLEKLYDCGARNFLLVNYPELQKSPFMRGSDIPRYYMDIGADLVQYNARLAFTAHRLAERHPDMTVFYYDNHQQSLAVREWPKHYPETARLEHFEGFCYPYRDNHYGDLPTEDVFDELCTVPLDAWFWRDESHHTEPYHRLIARKMSELMSDPSNRLPWEFY